MALNLAIGAALTGLGALQGLFHKKQVSDSNYSSSSTPNYDPKNLSFRDFLIDSFTKRASGDGAAKFEKAYTEGGLKNLFQTNQTALEGVNGNLAARGLLRTTAGANASADAMYRGADKTASFLNNVPLIMDQRQFDNLGAAGSYQAGLPVGTNTTGTSHTEGNVPGTGGFGGAFTGGASTLAGFMGQYYANKNFGDILKSIKPGG